MSFQFSTRSVGNMAGINPRLRKTAEEAIKITKVDFGIPETGGLRTAEQQRELYEKGVSNADGVKNISYHQSGRALDFYAIDPETGEASWDKGLLAQVAASFFQSAMSLNVKLEWGGLWKSFEDYPHIQLPKGDSDV